VGLVGKFVSSRLVLWLKILSLCVFVSRVGLPGRLGGREVGRERGGAKSG